MKKFTIWQVEEAIEYSMKGGQALHLHNIIPNEDTAPRCFVDAVNRGEDIAHLFDQDARRLKNTAAILGVNIIVIEYKGTPHMHVDLCGRPLRKAILQCDQT
jgi:hypothetical protein